MKSSMRAGDESPLGAPLFEVLVRLPARRDELPRIVAGLDHAALVHASLRHGVAVWVADALAAQRVTLDSEPMRALQQGARAQLREGLRLQRLTLTVLEALARRGVTPVLLKGAGLAERLFPEQPLGRPSTDVDVLVSPGELSRAQVALEALGLRVRTDTGHDDVFEEHHHLSLSAPQILVELHFRLFSDLGRGRFDERALWSRTRKGTFAGRAVRWLSAEDELGYLAVHAANHAFLRVSWLLDLVRYLEKHPSLDWAALSARFRGTGLSAAIGVALEVLRVALQAPVPVEAQRAFPIGRSRRALCRRLFSPAHLESAAGAEDRLGRLGLRAVLVDAPGDGLRLATEGLVRQWRRLRKSAS